MTKKLTFVFVSTVYLCGCKCVCVCVPCSRKEFPLNSTRPTWKNSGMPQHGLYAPTALTRSQNNKEHKNVKNP